jgi:hypothetical protein
LSEIEYGNPAAAERLLPLVYDELRQLASAKLANDRKTKTKALTTRNVSQEFGPGGTLHY